MKNFLLLITLIWTGSVFAQEPVQLWNNFYKSSTNQLYWQQISETTFDINQLVNAIKISGYYEDVDVIENQIVCKLKAYSVPYKNYGFSYVQTPMYITKNVLTATAVFEIKDQRMRATIKNIQFILNSDDHFGGRQNNMETFEEWVLNSRNEIKDSFFMDGSNIFNQDFTVRTTFPRPDNNW